MNLPTKQSETHKNEHGCWGKGILGSLGRSHPHCYIQNTKMTRTYCIAKNKQSKYYGTGMKRDIQAKGTY